MNKFAHISDVHIGAFRQVPLQNLVVNAFTEALDTCLKRKVDFVLICGDLFDSNIPDMALLNSTVKKMLEVKNAGIPLYVIYGSHDFSPTQTSMVDILESAGLFTKVTKGTMKDGHLILEFTTDGKTKTKMCGISGRRRGIDKQYFEVLDREVLENEDGFKIFLLHGALGEYKPQDLAGAESMPVSNLPKGFAYYACGHIHEKFQGNEYGFNVAYPGTLFGADFPDLEKSARGEERGFFIVDFDSKVERMEFVPISVCGYELIEYDATGKTSVTAQREITERVTACEPRGKIVLLKVAGEMSGGKTSDVDFQQFMRALKENGAIEVLVNHHRLTSKEYAAVKVGGQNVSEIEETLFRESIGTIRISKAGLRGEAGIKLSREVLAILKKPKIDNETKSTYEDRIAADTIDAMGTQESFEE